MYYKFTARAEKALELAQELAMDLGHNYIGTEHLLYGLVAEGTGVACKVLVNQGLTEDGVKQEIEEIVGMGATIENPEQISFTPRSKRVIENAFLEARRTGTEYIGTEHILIGIMKEGDSVAIRIMMEEGAAPQKIYNELNRVLTEDVEADSEKQGNKMGSYNSTPTLNQYGVDLTKQAKEGKLDPVIGRKEELSEDIIESINNLEEKTKNNTGLNFTIAINYGGRDEIVRAVRKIADKVKAGEIETSDIDEAMISDNLDTAGIPDPDLLIRTSGEQRLSNYLPWQLAYTEFYFTDVYWPDFNREELIKACEKYNKRERRYGGVKEE